MPSIVGGGREYFIIVLARERKKLRGMRFKPSETYKGILLERELREDEVRHFKNMSEQFNKIIHDKDGRVYEINNNSFKKYYDDKVS